MKVEDFFPFYGSSDLDDGLDDALAALKIKARPKGDDSTVYVGTSDKKTSFSFESRETFLDIRLLPPKADGQFLLVKVDVYPGSELELPYGLHWEMSGNDVQAALGNPTELGSVFDSFYRGLYYTVCRYKKADKNSLSSIGFGILDTYTKERLGL